jgi:hypothetical protein
MLSFQKCLSLLLDSRKDAGKLALNEVITQLSLSIVEFSNPEDAKRAKEELADKQVLGRPVFIREVRSFTLCRHAVTYPAGPRGDRTIRSTPYPWQDRHGYW